MNNILAAVLAMAIMCGVSSAGEIENISAGSLGLFSVRSPEPGRVFQGELPPLPERVPGLEEDRGPSQNFARKLLNIDGSVTIVGPKFSYAEGSGAISYFESDNDGVCKLFGYPGAVTAVKAEEAAGGRHAVINHAGKLGYFSVTSTVYDSVICADGRVPAVSALYKDLHTNDDGSVTLVGPRFDWRGVPSAIDYFNSDNAGVCKLFGYGRAVTEIRAEDASEKLHPVIGAAGKLGYLAASSVVYGAIVCAD